MSSNIVLGTFEKARIYDRVVWNNDSEVFTFSERYNARRNANGRKFIIGSVVGVCRVISSIAKVALASIGAIFCLAGAGLSSPLALAGIRKPMSFSLCKAKECGFYVLDNIKGVARGFVEIVPFTGIALAKYDIKQYEDKGWKIVCSPSGVDIHLPRRSLQ